MIEIIFAPNDQHAAKIGSLSRRKIDLLASLLSDVVTETFHEATSADVQCSPTGRVKITMHKLAMLTDDAIQTYTQRLTNMLVVLKLDELYHVEHVKTLTVLNDNLLAPEQKEELHFPETLLEVFDLKEAEIPEHFMCPISGRIMCNPAYLTSNPKVSYEYYHLSQWIFHHDTDPVTRLAVSAPGIVRNNDLRKQIHTFVMDRVLGKPVQHYFESLKKDASTQCSLASNNCASLFAKTKLNGEFFAVAARALRRLSLGEDFSENEMQSLLNHCGADNIVNMQDSNSESQKTALHIAVMNNNVAAAKLLLRNGAQGNIQDASKETARSLAEKSENAEIRALFLSATATARR